MSLNIEYLQQLSAFTKFANVRINAEDKNAVACITQDGGNVQEISKNSLDKPYAFFPLVLIRTNKQMNNETRALFKNTIANLFGGEDKIPQSVKDDMHFGTFDGKGHPLTAKRINIVKNSILKAIKENPYAGISEGEAMRILNAHGSDQIIDEPINRDSLTNTKFSINDDGDKGNDIISTNNNTTKSTSVKKTEEDPIALKNELSKLIQMQSDGKKLTQKQLVRLADLQQKVNGVGVMPTFGVQSDTVMRILNKNTTPIVKEEKKHPEEYDENFKDIALQHGKKPKTKKQFVFTE